MARGNKEEIGMNYRSHAKEEVIEALKQDKKVFALDTGNYGEDDVLIG